MGGVFGQPMSQLLRGSEKKMFLLGLDGVGKTTMLYGLPLGEIVPSSPTVGFTVEDASHKNISVTAWTVGVRDDFMPLWRYLFREARALIFVVDSNDRERISKAKEELYKVLSLDELKDVVLLVFANKQDIANCMSAKEVEEQLDLQSLKNREWHIEGSSGKSGKGLVEGLDWLSLNIK